MADISQNAQQAYQLLVQMGYQPHQAAGIVGNLIQESGPSMSPTITGDKGRAFGIAQWRDSRRQDLNRFAAKGGMDPNHLETQIKFLDNELRTTERGTLDAINRSSTPQEAASAFLGFERPLGYSQRNPQLSSGYDNRVANAADVYAMYKDQASNRFTTSPPDQAGFMGKAQPSTDFYGQAQPQQTTGALTVNPITGDPLYPYSFGS